jgi:hypothetical protein
MIEMTRFFWFKDLVTNLGINFLRNSDSKFLGSLCEIVITKTANILGIRTLHFRIRQLVSLSQPSNPLSAQNLPTINVAIPCHKKDFDGLELVIQGARATVMNPIGKFILITPEFWVHQLSLSFSDCEVLSDESILDENVIQAINKFVPVERRGWIVQQILKFVVVLRGDVSATLVIDADTVLVQPRVWLDDKGNQIICISEEYHFPYKHHQRRSLGLEPSLFSFVTHHQLMKSDSVRELFGDEGHGILKWLSDADFTENSAISEYDTYGEWIVTEQRQMVQFAKWNNLEIDLGFDQIDYKELASNYKRFHSVSSHKRPH